MNDFFKYTFLFLFFFIYGCENKKDFYLDEDINDMSQSLGPKSLLAPSEGANLENTPHTNFESFSLKLIELGGGGESEEATLNEVLVNYSCGENNERYMARFHSSKLTVGMDEVTKLGPGSLKEAEGYAKYNYYYATINQSKGDIFFVKEYVDNDENTLGVDYYLLSCGIILPPKSALVEGSLKKSLISGEIIDGELEVSYFDLSDDEQATKIKVKTIYFYNL